jgi:dihydrofolate reductase
LQGLTDAVIWVRKTYEIMASYRLTVPHDPPSTPGELEHARFLDAATKIVVSHTLERVAWNDAQNTVLIKDHIVEGIHAIKQQPGKDIWFIGSPTQARTFMELDRIDEYRITINPTILGDGKAFFAGVTRSFPLKLQASKTFQSGVVALRYEPDRSAK